ncbi:kinesin-like protein KIN-7C [Prosopis cineraria]|uniref:kinesin-like protein KIN-7C n=1 Tax=Prosopis cineraria TaxID=364024 RepID=UPI00240F8AD2|nr:kinesin-like protein KIN-7C [Prosopis cineraria]
MRETPRSNGHEERIFVSVRVRPLNEKEKARNDVSEWECISPNSIQCKNTFSESSSSMDTYTFDNVFRDGCSTQHVYEAGVKAVALSVLGGINSSVFAYGQTSSGKTYTMTGITELAVRDIYDYIETHQDREFVLRFSAMEIYNENVRDLQSADNNPLRLLDDPRRGTIVEKLKEELLTGRSHLQQLLSICAAQRTTKETSVNETSSRSHQILRLTIESSPSHCAGTSRSGILVASVYFVDLAGSERASQALTKGTRLREGGHINRSLLTLGTVIRKLSKERNGHIPYRDSKLTRILQNSLGGNARTAIICTISPTRNHVEQSKNTLFFAGCAKQVATNAQVNVMMSDKILVKHLQKELARMENELRSLAPNTVMLKEKELQIEQMNEVIKELTRERDTFQSHVENLLQSVGKDQLLSVYRDMASECSGFTNNLHPDTDPRTGNASEVSNEPRRIETLLNKHLAQQPENPEDNFLLDGHTPEFIGPDPCKGWEEIAGRVNPEYGDNCREVHCTEGHEVDVNLFVAALEDIGGKSPMRLVKNGDAKSSKEDNELIHEPIDNNQDVLQQKIEDLQRTIERLGDFAEKFNRSSELYISPSSSFQLTRSNSCRSVVAATCHLKFDQVDQEITPHSQPGKLEFEEMLSPQLDQPDHIVMSPSKFNKPDKEPVSPPQFDDKSQFKTLLLPQFKKPEAETVTSLAKVEKENPTSSPYFHDKLSERKFQAKKWKSSKEHLQTHQMVALDEVESVMDSDVEDTASVLNFVVKINGRSKTARLKDFDDLMVQSTTHGFNNEMGKARLANFQGVPGVSLPSKFERQQRYMVELWDACNVPLVHRSYYFLLIVGELWDPMYLDIELRRLSFLKEKFSTGAPMIEDSQNLTPDLSRMALDSERKMLSKKVHKKLSRKEREKCYLNWGIDLKSKHRSIQLAWRLWTNTQDMEHLRESAILVAKLIGLTESNEAQKKTFGHNFLALFKSRKSLSFGVRYDIAHDDSSSSLRRKVR